MPKTKKSKNLLWCEAGRNKGTQGTDVPYTDVSAHSLGLGSRTQNFSAKEQRSIQCTVVLLLLLGLGD